MIDMLIDFCDRKGTLFVKNCLKLKINLILSLKF